MVKKIKAEMVSLQVSDDDAKSANLKLKTNKGELDIEFPAKDFMALGMYFYSAAGLAEEKGLIHAPRQPFLAYQYFVALNDLGNLVLGFQSQDKLSFLFAIEATKISEFRELIQKAENASQKPPSKKKK